MTSGFPSPKVRETPRRIPPRRGFALIASLIILAMLALLGAASMTATNTEIQISSSMEDSARSFHAAEAGVSAGAAAVFDDTGQLDFVGDSTQLDFSSASPDPLAHLHNDTPTDAHNDLPTVTAVVSGDPEGKCARSEWASSDDLIGCGAFDLVSAHSSGDADSARGHVTTTLRLGISRQIIANN
ncbi:hypothetical protein CKO31_11710 [Thiohalocapsa halophila]|uniref:Type 4 fimbrial biogenesis protein PilX N-terminal domain-containing protein n=1 Tax=Thiohalocapsa halophila TaxID=69359 RepID=A0ABS1CHJ7_9GAMM|nr:PilX N-terminal domain-containing pilus assembly protein [Thiohalocapsa halophila]MBK1631395.1 hypothetical protein [Thiohalocapsa halophila]